MVDQAVETISKRYYLRRRVGRGGMGMVFRAFDRLNQHDVALKRVLDLPEAEGSKPSDASVDARLGLAHEFQTLASLHHPNIIRVLDYGFDMEQQPYFTMSLLEGAKPITEYGQGKSLADQMKLIIEMLQALAYMHRRNIIHRDLKPDNALVTAEGEVKVLDFGLATPQGQSEESEIAGTMAYIAPEILQGIPVSKASDLYAVGIMAYEMIAGQHPFRIDSAGMLIQDIFFNLPDVSELDVPEEVADVIERLTLKEPHLRYNDAYEIIEDLSRAMKQPVPKETAAIRESFLQAAEFVGRDAEMKKLQAALKEAIEGRGSVWIVGGESGVGKSRLLAEVSTQAMVRGALVVHGQAAADGGVAYQVWRDPLRRLVLSAALEESEASILKQILPEIGILLEHEIPDVPELEGSAGMQRLMETITKLFRLQEQTIVLVMEDLQWAEESLNVLNYINRMTSNLPLLIIANYRDDEAPDLPERLPHAEVMKLERLDEAGIGQLSTAMLGDVGKRPEVVELLQRETEGNVFFLVEVVRALAEDAGSLQRIGLMTLPANIFAGGVQQVVQRRLEHVPFEARNLLRIAAIAGRQLDLKLLRAIEPGINLDAWLVTCSNVAVLEASDEYWRFAHDKLREGLLSEISAEQTRDLHILVAEKLQAVYADNVDEYALVIARHYEEAQDMRQAQHWHARAGKYTHRIHAMKQAYDHYKRALELHEQIPNPIENEYSVSRLELLNNYADVLRDLGRMEESMNYWQRGKEEAVAVGNREYEVHGWTQEAWVEFLRGNTEKALEILNESEAIAREAGLNKRLTHVLWIKGWCLLRVGDMQGAIQLGDEAKVIGKAADTPINFAQAANLVAMCHMYLGRYDEAIDNFNEALATQEVISDLGGATMTMNNIGWLQTMRGNYDIGLEYYDKAIKRAQEMGIRGDELMFRGNRGGAFVRLDRYEDAVKELLDILDSAQTTGLAEVSEMYRFLAEAYLGLDDTKKALAAATKALTFGLKMENPEYVGAAWCVLSQIAAAMGGTAKIEVDGETKTVDPALHFAESERLLRENSITHEQARTLRAWALYEMSQQNRASAAEKWEQAREIYQAIGADRELKRMAEIPTD